MRPATPHEIFRSRIKGKVSRALKEMDFKFSIEQMKKLPGAEVFREGVRSFMRGEDYISAFNTIDEGLKTMGEAMGEIMAKRLHDTIEAME